MGRMMAEHCPLIDEVDPNLTLDGLRINTKMQVLDTEGNPIEGLYSAGDCSGGFFAHNYPEYIVGVAIGRTLTEGYLLGDELAKA